MKFTFSSNFRQSLYQQLLSVIGAEIDTYRQISGITLSEMMDNLHMSYPIIKRFQTVSRLIPFIILP